MDHILNHVMHIIHVVAALDIVLTNIFGFGLIDLIFWIYRQFFG